MSNLKIQKRGYQYKVLLDKLQIGNPEVLRSYWLIHLGLTVSLNEFS